jgi:hypothetical protein
MRARGEVSERLGRSRCVEDASAADEASGHYAYIRDTDTFLERNGPGRSGSLHGVTSIPHGVLCCTTQGGQLAMTSSSTRCRGYTQSSWVQRCKHRHSLRSASGHKGATPRYPALRTRCCCRRLPLQQESRASNVCTAAIQLRQSCTRHSAQFGTRAEM